MLTVEDLMAMSTPKLDIKKVYPSKPIDTEARWHGRVPRPGQHVEDGFTDVKIRKVRPGWCYEHRGVALSNTYIPKYRGVVTVDGLNFHYEPSTGFWVPNREAAAKGYTVQPSAEFVRALRKGVRVEGP
jgi:hypothetical protein